MKIHNLSAFLLEFKIFFLISNFKVILYLNWVLVFIAIMDVILYFILIDFTVVPSKQNVFVVL